MRRKEIIVRIGSVSPFGAPLDNRTFNAGSYRYGFNGQEKDDELYGAGNAVTAEFWEYDARLGRRLDIDPEIDPEMSSYATFDNNPVVYADPSGAEPEGGEGPPSSSDEEGSGSNTVFKPGKMPEGGEAGNSNGDGDHTYSVRSPEESYIGKGDGYFKRGGEGGESGDGGDRKGGTGGLNTPKGITPPFNIPSNNTGTIGQRQPNSWEKLKNWTNSQSDNIFTYSGKIATEIGFNTINDLYIYYKGFQYTPDQAYDLTGAGVNRNQYAHSGFSSILNFAPTKALQVSVSEYKVLNAAQFNKAFKGTSIVRGSPALRGARIVLFNQQTRIIQGGVGIGLKTIGKIQIFNDLNDAIFNK